MLPSLTHVGDVVLLVWEEIVLSTCAQSVFIRVFKDEETNSPRIPPPSSERILGGRPRSPVPPVDMIYFRTDQSEFSPTHPVMVSIVASTTGAWGGGGAGAELW